MQWKLTDEERGEIAERFWKFRKENLLTLREMAELMGSSWLTVWEVEKKRRKPTMETLRKFEAAKGNVGRYKRLRNKARREAREAAWQLKWGGVPK